MTISNKIRFEICFLAVIALTMAIEISDHTKNNKEIVKNSTMQQEQSNSTQQQQQQQQQHQQQQQQKFILAKIPIKFENLDSRSAFINNQYVPDEEIVSISDTSSPYYQLLQQQMASLAAHSGNMPMYTMQHNDMNKPKKPPQSEFKGGADNDLRPPHRPIFNPDADYANANDKNDYDMEEAEESAEETDQNKHMLPHYEATATNSVLHSSTTTLRPRISTSTVSSSTATTRHGQIPLTVFGNELILKPPPPSASPSQQHAYPNSNIYHSTLAPTTTSSIMPPTTSLKPKRRIAFKTVSTGSQFISTPIADLMLKFSIGIAKPARSGKTFAAAGDNRTELNSALIARILKSLKDGNISTGEQFNES